MIELLSNEQMRRADALSAAAGTPGFELMRAAGTRIAEAARDMFAQQGPQPIIVVCGPGNNGGDGFIAAQWLAGQGRSVLVVLLGERAALQGDAALAAAEYSGDVRPYETGMFAEGCGIVDALFGSGLSRDIDGEAAALIEAINASKLPVLSIDVPSGVDGDSGEVRGCAVRATKTITFFRLRPGHCLLPGRDLCGELEYADIGIDPVVLSAIHLQTFINRPLLWADRYPVPALDGHKYQRGHALVVSGGPYATGAARLAARAALRIGAGLVSVVSSPEAASINAAQLTAIMLKVYATLPDFAALIADPRLNAVLIGPGAGIGEETRARVLMLLATDRDVVLDADALTSFEHQPQELFDAVQRRPGQTLLTPHDGEFARLFRDSPAASRLVRARHAAVASGAVVLLKGADTVVADPGGQAAINVSGSRWLASAGTGDVLAGMAAGLLAQRMPAFKAACAAVCLHGLAARRIGPGLIAEDIPERLPAVVADLLRDLGLEDGDRRLL